MGGFISKEWHSTDFKLKIFSEEFMEFLDSSYMGMNICLYLSFPNLFSSSIPDHLNFRMCTKIFNSIFCKCTTYGEGFNVGFASISSLLYPPYLPESKNIFLSCSLEGILLIQGKYGSISITYSTCWACLCSILNQVFASIVPEQKSRQDPIA